MINDDQYHTCYVYFVDTPGTLADVTDHAITRRCRSVTILLGRRRMAINVGHWLRRHRQQIRRRGHGSTHRPGDCHDDNIEEGSRLEMKSSRLMITRYTTGMFTVIGVDVTVISQH